MTASLRRSPSLTVAGEALTIPANMIRFRASAAAATVEGIDLALHWPSLRLSRKASPMRSRNFARGADPLRDDHGARDGARCHGPPRLGLCPLLRGTRRSGPGRPRRPGAGARFGLSRRESSTSRRRRRSPSSPAASPRRPRKFRRPACATSMSAPACRCSTDSTAASPTGRQWTARCRGSSPGFSQPS